jgi:phosphate transport system permease protein
LTDLTSDPAAIPAGARKPQSLYTVDSLTKRRNAAEFRFRMYGIVAIVISLSVLALMLFTIFSDGISAFRQASVTFPVTLDAERLDPDGNRNRDEMAAVTTIGYSNLLKAEFAGFVNEQGFEVEGLTDEMMGDMLSRDAAAQVRNQVLADPDLLGTTIEVTVLANGRIDGYLKGRVNREEALRDKNVTPEQLDLTDKLVEADIVTVSFNWGFLTRPDASDQRPESAGLGVAIIGSAYMMLIVLVLTLPIGVAASIYLEEFAPKNWFTDMIEVNISNLAAVPSIVFGILGLAAFINFAGLPQSSSVVGGLVLTLVCLPTIIIATRASIKAVPPSIRDAALGVGASKMQTVFHHVLPLAMPGILTGTILALATALGETAPLLLIGMVAFVGTHPSAPIDGFFEPATALPVQVYGWASRSDPAFLERSSGAVIVLLFFLLIMNAVAIVLRRRFERRW